MLDDAEKHLIEQAVRDVEAIRDAVKHSAAGAATCAGQQPQQTLQHQQAIVDQYWAGVGPLIEAIEEQRARTEALLRQALRLVDMTAIRAAIERAGVQGEGTSELKQAIQHLLDPEFAHGRLAVLRETRDSVDRLIAFYGALVPRDGV